MLRAKSKAKLPDNTRFVVAMTGAVMIFVAGLAYWAWSGTPQLAADGDVYASLDALFTAVTARREPLVANCESQLASLHADGKIPEQAWRKISRVIELAKTGEWESAAKNLYLFIERQKRST